MKIITIAANNLEQYRRPLLLFVKRYADNKECYRWLYQLRKHHLHAPGTSVKISLWDGKIVAVLAVSEYGTKHSLFILAPNYQYPHIGCTLLEEMKRDLHVCYTKISYKETELIKMALNADFASLTYSVEQDGSLNLWFGGGHWHKNDLLEKEVSYK